MSRRILVADDDAMSVQLVAGTMVQLGYEVVCADDGDSLLQHLADEGPFDLVITDVAMPWMSGLQVAHSAREAGLPTPVIIMTALPLDADEIATLGPESCLLRKPFRTAQLIAQVLQLLHGRPSRAAARRGAETER